MPLLLALVVGSVVTGGLVLRHWHRQGRTARRRNNARLHAIAGQLAALRAALRIQVAEHVARQRMQTLRSERQLTPSTLHEKPEWWWRS